MVSRTKRRCLVGVAVPAEELVAVELRIRLQARALPPRSRLRLDRSHVKMSRSLSHACSLLPVQGLPGTRIAVVLLLLELLLAWAPFFFSAVA